MALFEICANSYESAINAQLGGADRIELCSCLELGGLTPTSYSIMRCKEELKIPVHVLIRPRAGNFIYTPDELEIIEYYVNDCKKLDVDGIVCGFLDSRRNINKWLTKTFMKIAYPMSFTFHRAFDDACNPFEALDDLIECGVPRVLTSGTADKAIEATDILEKLVKQAGDKIIVMPGGGINENNIVELYSKTKAREYHFSAKAIVPPNKQKDEYSAYFDYPIQVSDVSKIRNTIGNLNSFIKANK